MTQPTTSEQLRSQLARHRTAADLEQVAQDVTRVGPAELATLLVALDPARAEELSAELARHLDRRGDRDGAET